MKNQNSEQPEEREWANNNDWYFWEEEPFTAKHGDSRTLIHGTRRVRIRWVFRAANGHENAGDQDLFFRGLAYDQEGIFYAMTSAQPGGGGEPFTRSSLIKLTGKQALTWFAQNASWDEAFSRELCRAIDNPQFEFMPLVPQRVAQKPARKKRKAAEAFHQQLHMATALVESVRKLDAEPSIENLADACRSASALHTAIHAPENFKLASA